LNGVWIKFTSKMTSNGITFSNDKITEKFLPSFTFCPWPVYKKKGFYYKEKDFIENTFSIEDIFHNWTLPNLRNRTLYNITEVQSLLYGRCYTISKQVLIGLCENVFK
jgi:hypothetical protein